MERGTTVTMSKDGDRWRERGHTRAPDRVRLIHFLYAHSQSSAILSPLRASSDKMRMVGVTMIYDDGLVKLMNAHLCVYLVEESQHVR